MRYSIEGFPPAIHDRMKRLNLRDVLRRLNQAEAAENHGPLGEPETWYIVSFSEVKAFTGRRTAKGFVLVETPVSYHARGHVLDPENCGNFLTTDYGEAQARAVSELDRQIRRTRKELDGYIDKRASAVKANQPPEPSE